MSCPSWKQLTAHRRDRFGSEPAEWWAALEHRRVCSHCQRASVFADPSLIFSNLPEVELSAGEVERMKRGVADLRRARAIEVKASGLRQWTRMAATVLLAAAMSLLLGSPMPHVDEESGAVGAAAFLEPALALMPLAEDFDRPEARIYQLGSQDLSVVMIVDESLDV